MGKKIVGGNVIETKQRFSAPVRRGFSLINSQASLLTKILNEQKVGKAQKNDLEAALRYIEENKE